MLYAVADIHLANHRTFGGIYTAGLNERARAITGILRRAADVAGPEDKMLVLGDVFDTDAPAPALIFAAQQALRSVNSPSNVHVIKGNHDMSSTDLGHNACAPLSGHCFVEEEPRVLLADKAGVTAGLMIPFAVPVREAILTALAHARTVPAWRAAKQRLVFGHWGIAAPDDPVYLREAHDAIDAAELAAICFDFDVCGVAAGNWHKRRQFEFSRENKNVRLLQVGCLAPTGFDNPGWDGYGTVASWNASKAAWQYRELPGPRFLRHVPTIDEINAHLGCQVYVRVDGSADEQETLKEQLAKLPLQGRQTRIKSAEKLAAAKAAAAAASAANTVESALAGYVENMKLPPFADRAEVQKLALQLLAGAA
jgi:hypothetical protein